MVCICIRYTSLQFSSVAQSCPTLCDPMNHSTSGLPVHHQLPESTQPLSIESVMPSNSLILCHPFLLLPSISSTILPLLPSECPQETFSMSRQEADCKYLSWSPPSPFQEMQTGGWP